MVESYIVSITLGYEYIHFGRLCSDDVNTFRLFTQVDLATIGLINIDCWQDTYNLHLDALAVDDINRGDDGIKQKEGLLATI